jgi:hypothetical protein
MVKTLGVGEKSSVTAWTWRTSQDVGGELVMATIDLVGKNKSISWVVEIVRNLGMVIAKALGLWNLTRCLWEDTPQPWYKSRLVGGYGGLQQQSLWLS